MVTECGVKPFCIGVSVTVKCKTGGVAVVAEPDADGYIFGLEEVEKATIIIKVDTDISVFGFGVVGKKCKDIVPAKNYSRARFGTHRKGIYRREVPIRRNEEGESRTLYRENHIKLLEIGTGGYFAVWEAAIVFQNGLGFLTSQRVYEGFVYRSGIGLSCPEFNEKWPQLVSFIECVCKRHGFSYMDFPHLGDYALDLEISMDTHDVVGGVKWFNVAQGFGAIYTNKGDAVVHYKDIYSPERLICMEAGDIVLFEKLIPNTSGKGFPYKAVGVLEP